MPVHTSFNILISSRSFSISASETKLIPGGGEGDGGVWRCCLLSWALIPHGEAVNDGGWRARSRLGTVDCGGGCFISASSASRQNILCFVVFIKPCSS